MPNLVTFVIESACDLGTCETATIKLQKLIDFNTSHITSHKHKVGMDKIFL
jgi:hypothetical protein